MANQHWTLSHSLAVRHLYIAPLKLRQVCTSAHFLRTDVRCLLPLLHLQSDPLWSARLLHSNPQMIRDIYLSYLRAGADMIITASYKVCEGRVLCVSVGVLVLVWGCLCLCGGACAGVDQALCVGSPCNDL